MCVSGNDLNISDDSQKMQHILTWRKTEKNSLTGGPLGPGNPTGPWGPCGPWKSRAGGTLENTPYNAPWYFAGCVYRWSTQSRELLPHGDDCGSAEMTCARLRAKGLILHTSRHPEPHGTIMLTVETMAGSRSPTDSLLWTLAINSRQGGYFNSKSPKRKIIFFKWTVYICWL